MSEPNHAQSGDARLERVEEAAAFSERAIEQLSDEIAEMNKRLAALGKRMAMLEERLGKVVEERERGVRMPEDEDHDQD